MSAKKKTTETPVIETGISLGMPVNEIISKIPGMIERLDKRIKELKRDATCENRTANKKLTGYGEIKTISNVSKLIKAHASVILRRDSYTASLKELGLDAKKYPLSLDGAPPKAWLDDIATRVEEVKHKDEITKLQAAKKKLEENLSAEQKLARDLKGIADILSE